MKAPIVKPFAKLDPIAPIQGLAKGTGAMEGAAVSTPPTVATPKVAARLKESLGMSNFYELGKLTTKQAVNLMKVPTAAESAMPSLDSVGTKAVTEGVAKTIPSRLNEYLNRPEVGQLAHTLGKGALGVVGIKMLWDLANKTSPSTILSPLDRQIANSNLYNQENFRLADSIRNAYTPANQQYKYSSLRKRAADLMEVPTAAESAAAPSGLADAVKATVPQRMNSYLKTMGPLAHTVGKGALGVIGLKMLWDLANKTSPSTILSPLDRQIANSNLYNQENFRLANSIRDAYTPASQKMGSFAYTLGKEAVLSKKAKVGPNGELLPDDNKAAPATQTPGAPVSPAVITPSATPTAPTAAPAQDDQESAWNTRLNIRDAKNDNLVTKGLSNWMAYAASPAIPGAIYRKKYTSMTDPEWKERFKNLQRGSITKPDATSGVPASVAQAAPAPAAGTGTEAKPAPVAGNTAPAASTTPMSASERYQSHIDQQVTRWENFMKSIEPLQKTDPAKYDKLASKGNAWLDYYDRQGMMLENQNGMGNMGMGGMGGGMGGMGGMGNDQDTLDAQRRNLESSRRFQNWRMAYMPAPSQYAPMMGWNQGSNPYYGMGYQGGMSGW